MHIPERRCAGSGGGERVVAELGQDVAGLPDDLAGLRQGGGMGRAGGLSQVPGAGSMTWAVNWP